MTHTYSQNGLQQLRDQLNPQSTNYSEVSFFYRITKVPDIIKLIHELFTVVYHHGISAGGGHYTCDIRRQNNQWLHLDDTTITEIPESNVVMDDRAAKYNHFTGEQTAYILFYIRA